MITDNRNSLVIVTGCDSGMGMELAQLLVNRGFAVLASYLEENIFHCTENLFTHRLDLRDEESIMSFTAYAGGIIDRGFNLYALVNNAGIAKGGPVESIPLAMLREVMEVNFFGLAAVTREMIPYLIQSRGRIIIHGSMAGKIALPFLSPYTASKAALEGYTGSLRRELNPLGIKTVLLNTAGVATPIWNKAREQDMSMMHSRYRESLKQFREKFIDAGNSGLDQHIAAEKILRIIMKKNPAPRYIIARSRLVSKLELMIPEKLFDLIVKKLFSMNYRS